MLNPLELLNAVKVAECGTFIKYYEGSLAIYATKDKRSIQKASYFLYEEGLVLLVAERLEKEIYSYYAVRTKAPYTKHYHLLQELKWIESQP